MSIAGQSNYRGVNAQAKAAILLFLANFPDADFDSITLEDSAWEDFTLNFKSGKKAVCESKAWRKKLMLNDVIDILGNIAGRDGKLGARDEVIIVCNEVADRLERDLEYLSYNLALNEIPTFKKYRKKEKLTQPIIELLKKVRFYKLPASNKTEAEDYIFNETVARLYQLIPFWMPQDEVERLMTHVLKTQIYDKSEIGKSFTKQELITYLDDYKTKRIERAGAYNLDKEKITKEVDRMINAATDTDEKYLLNGDNLVSLSAQPMKMYIALDLIVKQTPLVLRDWNAIWDALIDRSYSFRIVHIFEQSIEDRDNASYMIDFLNKNMLRLNSPLIDRHNRDYALEIVAKIVKRHQALAPQVLEYIRAFLKSRDGIYLDALGKRDLSYEKDNVIKVLDGIYEYGTGKSDSNIISSVIALLDEHFNLAEDDSEHALLTPNSAFVLIRKWLESDFEANLPLLLDILGKHYRKSKYYGDKFSGWELAGGIEPGWAKEYKIHDRNFIKLILRPAFLSRYEADRENFWQFLKNDLITTTEEQVSSRKPDFLSRAVIPILIEEYKTGSRSEEALDIISKFFGVHRGIPERYKLIFQEIIPDTSIGSDEKWTIAKQFLDAHKDKLPRSVFVEKVVLQAAVAGNKDALAYIEGWLRNPDYLQQQMRWNFFVDAIFDELIDSKDKEVASRGARLLGDYLATADFQDNLDKFHAWDLTPLVAKILKKNPSDGIRMLDLLYGSQGILPVNIQLIITSSLAKLEKEKPLLLKEIYDGFLKPVLFEKLGGDINKVVAKFSDHHAREDFVRFAEILVGANYFEEGLELVKLFIDDPDPSLKNYPDDPDSTFNYHQKVIEGDKTLTINTVRVWCAYALQKFIRVGGESYMDEVIRLVAHLMNDENYYVRFHALVPLTDLANNRHTVLPPESKVRFMSLANAQKVEDLAFEMLEDPENRSLEVVMDQLAYTFNHLRSITCERAKRLLELYGALSFEGEIEHLTALYIFFAEFRKDAFKKAIFKELFGDALYKEMQEYDDEYFQQLLRKKIKTAPEEMKSSFAWHFWKIPKETQGTEAFDKSFKLSYKYMKLFTEEYNHNVFERISHFIEDYIDQKFDECIELWKVATKAEVAYLTTNEKDIVVHQNWWAGLHTADILLKALAVKGPEEFLDCVVLALSYPESLPVLYKPNQVYEELKKLGGERATKMVSDFQRRYPYVYAEEQAKLRNARDDT